MGLGLFESVAAVVPSSVLYCKRETLLKSGGDHIRCNTYDSACVDLEPNPQFGSK